MQYLFILERVKRIHLNLDTQIQASDPLFWFLQKNDPLNYLFRAQNYVDLPIGPAEVINWGGNFCNKSVHTYTCAPEA